MSKHGNDYPGGDRAPGESTPVALVDTETGRRRGTVGLDLEGLLAAARSLNRKAPRAATTEPSGPTTKETPDDAPET